MISYFKQPKHILCLRYILGRQTLTAVALEYTEITNILKEKNCQ
jgi:hypothetical protein